MKYNKNDFLEMVRDWKVDNAPEYDDLAIDDPETNEKGEWVVAAQDEKNTYQLSDDGHGNIIVNYLGTNSKTWGGPREGAGRPLTGRKKQNFYITDEENEQLRKYLEELRASQ